MRNSAPREASEIELAPYIDHSLLSPAASIEQVDQWCDEADRYKFASVCVSPCHVARAVDRLHNKKPLVCTVIGFPSGATTRRNKLHEALEAVDLGAQELDLVINLGWLKSGQMDALYEEVAEICETSKVPVKVILEMSMLTEEEKRITAELCMDAGAAFLKTSTGWHGGATVNDVRLLREIARDRTGIKASGGIRTLEQAQELILAGATRIGTSYGVSLLQQEKA
jgi:deoxyribose-phosphate aldolase